MFTPKERRRSMSLSSRRIAWLAIGMLVITGLVHLLDAPDAFDEMTYKGLLFVANAAGALVAAVGIARGARGWGWGLGFAVSAGALVGYILSRTLGLPGLPAEPDAWLEPLGLISMMSEGLFVVLAAWAIGHQPAPSPRTIR
jgi:hypothetical protein